MAVRSILALSMPDESCCWAKEEVAAIVNVSKMDLSFIGIRESTWGTQRHILVDADTIDALISPLTLSDAKRAIR